MPDTTDPHEPIIPTRTRSEMRADLDAEFAAWIDERAAELAARGVEPGEARRRATTEFGDAEAARRYCATQDEAADQRVRWTYWVEELIADIRIAARGIKRSPAVTAVVLLTFAIGIGAMTAVFSAVHAVLLRPLPYRDENALVSLHSTEHNALSEGGQLSVGAMLALRERASTLSGIAGVGYVSYTLVRNGEPTSVPGGRVTANTFTVLGARPALGRTFATGEDSVGAPPVIVLSDALWRTQFGADSSIVGRRVDVTGIQREVIGVMPRDFRMPLMEGTQMWGPLVYAPLLAVPDRLHKFRFLRLIARERGSNDASQADLDRTMRALAIERPDAYTDAGARAILLREEIVGTVRSRLLTLLGAAALVLIIACANIAGVLVARAASRQHELAIRVALGAGRGRLVRHFLAEGIVLTGTGAILGVAAAAACIAGLRRIAADAMTPGTTLALEPRVVLFGVTVAVIGGMFFSIVPAMIAVGSGAGLAAGDGVRGAGVMVKRPLRLALIAGQLSLTLTLLVGAGLLTRSLGNLMARDLGYRTDHVLAFSVSLPQSRYRDNPAEDQFWSTLYSHLNGTPGVVAVGGTGMVPLGGSSGTGFVIDGRDMSDPRVPEVRYAVASDDYFAALDMPILKGRAFTAQDRGDAPPVAIVSQKLARRFWGDKDPIGARVRLGPDPRVPWNTIVGVVQDVQAGVDGDAQETVYASQRQDHWRSGVVVIRTSGEPQSAAGAARAAVHAADPLLPVNELMPLTQLRSSVLAPRRLPMQLMIVFGLTALLLSAVGVYGVCAYAVAARTREFGIRIALGATHRRIVRNAVRDGAVAAVIGVAIAIPLVWLLVRQLRDLLYGVRAADPGVMLASLGILLIVVALASIIPALRAARVDPLIAMRSD
jgi:predicted permease